MSTVLLAVLLAGSTSTTYVEVPPSGGGLISGKITYDGKPPAPAKLSMLDAYAFRTESGS